MKILEGFKTLGIQILDLVFPISCLVCGQDQIYLCEKCSLGLLKLEKQLCIVCTQPSPFGKTHPECVSRNTVDGMICALSYKDHNIKKIIETFKYNFVSDLSRPLTKFIVDQIKSQGLTDYFEEFILVPVPLHNRRNNWRGFNQAELLANELAAQLGLLTNNNLASRDKFTKPQTMLDAEDRKRNIAHAFSIRGETSNKKILLVDDVVTSGSTANELAKLFKQNKAAEVWVVSIAHG